MTLSHSVCNRACNYRKIRPCISHQPPLGRIFHGRYLHSSSWNSWNSWNSAGVQQVGVGQHLAESFPKTHPSVWPPSWLSSSRAWKTAAPGGCDIHTPTVVHGTTVVVSVEAKVLYLEQCGTQQLECDKVGTLNSKNNLMA